jgi:hypothetical protein
MLENENLNEACAVISRLYSPTLIKPLDFNGEPLYYKMWMVVYSTMNLKGGMS